jgi:hypothetical protein
VSAASPIPTPLAITPTTLVTFADPQPHRCNRTERLLAIQCYLCRAVLRGTEIDAMVRVLPPDALYLCRAHVP